MNTRHLCTFEGARGGEILHRIQSYGKFRPRERSEEHTSELQSQSNLVCRLLLEKKKKSSVLADSTLVLEPSLKPLSKLRHHTDKLPLSCQCITHLARSSSHSQRLAVCPTTQLLY